MANIITKICSFKIYIITLACITLSNSVNNSMFRPWNIRIFNIPVLKNIYTITHTYVLARTHTHSRIQCTIIFLSTSDSKIHAYFEFPNEDKSCK